MPEAARFAQFLDRRTRRPIPNDPAFYLQAYMRAFHYGVASRSHGHYNPPRWDRHSWAKGFMEFDMQKMGFRPAAVFYAHTGVVDQFLAQEVHLYHTCMEASHG